MSMDTSELLALSSFALGCAGYGVSWWLHRFIERRKPKEERKFDVWYTDIEKASFELCRLHLDVALVQTHLAGLIAHMPESFVPATFKALALGEGLERAVLAEAVRRGLAPAEAAEEAHGGASAPYGVVLPFPSGAPAEPALVWQGGALVLPRRAGRRG